MPSIEIAPTPQRPEPSTWPNDALTIAWLGHATVLINLSGSWLLTDPALERRIGIGRGRAKLGPRRLVEPALRPRELPQLDAILLSHAHMDHTDIGTLRHLSRDVPVVVQRGNADLVRRFRQVHELAWGNTVEGGGARVESTPERNGGARMIADKPRGYGGYVTQKPALPSLFAGDTAYTDVLTPLGQRMAIDLAVLPIGAYNPWINNHASPEQA